MRERTMTTLNTATESESSSCGAKGSIRPWGKGTITKHSFRTLDAMWNAEEAFLVDALKQDNKDKIVALLNSPTFCSMSAVQAFLHKNPSKPYTRNLLQLNESFALMALLWNPLSESPIHAHEGSGCWVKVVQGALEECLYSVGPNGLKVEKSTRMDVSSGCGYVDDNVGVHCMRNRGDGYAVSIHLYAPPFERCSVWKKNEKGRLELSCGEMVFDSVFGRVV